MSTFQPFPILSDYWSLIVDRHPLVSIRGLNKTAQSIACGEDSSIEITILGSKKLIEPLPPSSTQQGKACRLYYGGREEGRGRTPQKRVVYHP